MSQGHWYVSSVYLSPPVEAKIFECKQCYVPVASRHRLEDCESRALYWNEVCDIEAVGRQLAFVANYLLSGRHQSLQVRDTAEFFHGST